MENINYKCNYCNCLLNSNIHDKIICKDNLVETIYNILIRLDISRLIIILNYVKNIYK
jgi:hypothetical protein